MLAVHGSLKQARMFERVRNQGLQKQQTLGDLKYYRGHLEQHRASHPYYIHAEHVSSCEDAEKIQLADPQRSI